MKCLHCKAEFDAARPGQKFCSDKCRLRNWHLKTGGVQAISQVLVRLDTLGARLARIEAHLGLSIQPPFKSATLTEGLATRANKVAVGSPRNAHAQHAGEGVRVNSQKGEML